MVQLAVDRMILGVAMMVPMVPSMVVVTVLDHARERVRRVLLMKHMLRAVHEPNVALVRQHKAQRHAKRDGKLQKPAVPRERQHASYRYC